MLAYYCRTWYLSLDTSHYRKLLIEADTYGRILSAPSGPGFLCDRQQRIEGALIQKQFSRREERFENRRAIALAPESSLWERITG